MTAPARSAALRVGGLVPLSTLDYPGLLAAVVFCQGCPWRCRYCHNPHLMAASGDNEMSWAAVMAFLQRRAGLLDAVVFSGGEPTLQPSLPRAVQAVRGLGFKVGLHTAGSHPRRLERLLPLIDWVAMDIKAPFATYASVTGVRGSGAPAERSMRLILDSGLPHEFRTTVHASLLDNGGLARLADSLAQRGVRHYVVQECRSHGAACALGPAGPGLDGRTCTTLAGQFATFEVRRAA